MHTNGTNATSRGTNMNAPPTTQDATNFDDELNLLLSAPGVLVQNPEVSAELKKYIGALGQSDSWTTWVKLGDEHMKAGIGRLLAQRFPGTPPQILDIMRGLLTTPKVMRRFEEEVSSDLPQGSLSVLFRDHAVKHDVSALPTLAERVFGRTVTPLYAMFVEVTPA